MSVTGPAGDYPVVLGDPYSVDGQIYTPVDTTSYDEVGYAAPGNMGGAGITAAHKTLPLPSYVEVTSLVTGKTILARVERRGPMTGDRLISLSQDAQTQLGSEDGTPVRVRRVNPPRNRASTAANGPVCFRTNGHTAIAGGRAEAKIAGTRIGKPWKSGRTQDRRDIN